jgi:hypothetical protein
LSGPDADKTFYHIPLSKKVRNWRETADGFMLLQNKRSPLQRMRIHAGSVQKKKEPLFEGSLKQ